ncbi:type ISP restriction/modification enzyme [Rubripirellula obstinata]|uniref:type ISP restriction/modification enzyme n=1 Tax=Rubripirellula obstinata TaxID=406547 RepID=UPI00138FF753|nr:type ISP restriction/modification enzyme [Rubripirellula obstinata]
MTNSLEPPNSRVQKVLGKWFPALAHESHRVDRIKKEQKFTIIVGNPPYAGISANNSERAVGLVEAYKFIAGKPLNERKHWLQDDYKKFIRFVEQSVNSTGQGIVGFITNHGFIDDPTARGMRWSLLETFNQIFAYDLHGSLKKRELCPDGSLDQNVFDIEPGVAISLMARTEATLRTRKHSDLWGTQDLKSKTLNSTSVRSTHWAELNPVAKFFLLIPADLSSGSEYEAGIPIQDMFLKSSVGCVTARDSLTIHLDSAAVWETVKRFAELGEEDAREEFALGKDARDWKVSNAQADIRRSGPSKKLITPVQYRPFDRRFTYYTGQSRGFIGQPQPKVMTQFLRGENRGIAVGRQGGAADTDEWNVVIGTTAFTEFNLFRSGGNTLFPLYLFPNKEEAALLKDGEKHLNIKSAILRLFQDICSEVQDQWTLGQNIFDYIYAILHSNQYRERFYEFLKRDFPRIPVPSTGSVFEELAKRGLELFELHSAGFSSEQVPIFSGAVGSVVEKVSWTGTTIWIDKPQTIGFEAVSESEWSFRIGGYQPLEKWLKDRQAKGGKNPRPGRKLTKDDIEHYQKMVVAIRETIRLMGEIDEVIEQHGGWPGAFVTEPIELDSERDDAQRREEFLHGKNRCFANPS